MRGGYDYTPIPLSEASCIIAHLFVELALPCSCCNREDNDEIVIQGTAYDGTGAKIIIKGKEVRYYGKQRTLAAIRAGQCRPPALRSALRNCRKLIDNIEFAHENLPGVTDDAFAFWSRLAAGVKNQTAAWYKKDRERAAKLVT